MQSLCTEAAHLHVALRLHEAAHDAKGAVQLPIRAGRQAWDDCVVRPLAGCQAVGMRLVQDEAVAPVLQREATAVWHDACTCGD